MRHALCALVGVAALAASESAARAADLVLPVGGLVTIELLTSDAFFHNTLSLVSPANVGIVVTGCKLEPTTGLGGLILMSEKIAVHGCRVVLDADTTTPGIQGFPDNTTLVFNLCAQTSAPPTCANIWSSNPASNRDRIDHLHTTALHRIPFRNRIFQLNWEDQALGGDNDFNDLVAVVRVDGDSDGDGLWDDWEQFGIDVDGDGVADLDLPALGANPSRKDIFVQIDYMDCAVAGGDCGAGDTHSHLPDTNAIAAAVQAFANATTVTNPDGSTGITLHVDVNHALPHQNFLIIPNACFPGTAGTGFDAIKSDPANFGPQNARRFAYHYGVFSHLQTTTTTSSGCAELPGNDFQVSMGAFTGQIGTVQQQAGTFMHEFGHNLNLQHGGDDSTNRKPNYLSIMSYTFQLSGIPPTDPDGAGPMTAKIDYSRSALASLNESALSEPAGIGDGGDNTFFKCPGGASGTGAGNSAIDWNCNGDPIDTGVSDDTNSDVAIGTLTGFDDWANIKFDFQNVKDFEDGAHSPLAEPELDFETFQRTLIPDVAMNVAVSPDPVVTGSSLTYVLRAVNKGPSLATNVVVTDALPSSTTFVACSASAGGVCSGSGNNRTITFGSLPGGATATATLLTNAVCSVPNGTTISNTASVLSVPDSDSANDFATVKATALNPQPSIGPMTVDRSVLWPPNHKMVGVAVSYNVTDNCGPAICQLRVASNEPINGIGDGQTAPDWQVVDAKHVQLRAERAGGASGRIYTLTATCTDSAGGASSRQGIVTVPLDQR